MANNMSKELTVNITLNNMEGLTLEQLQKMGAKPVQPKGLTLAELQTMGAKPVAPVVPESKPGFFQSVAQGIAKPFLKLTSTVSDIANEATSIGADLFGNKKYANEIETKLAKDRTKGLDYGYFGKVTPLGQTGSALGDLKESVGVGVEAGATLAGGGVGSAKTVLGKAAQFGGIGALSAGGKAAAEDKSALDIAKDAAIGGTVGAVTGAAFGGVEKGIRGMSKLFGKAGDKIQTSVIKPTQADIKDGFSIETVKKYNLGGSLKQTFEKTDQQLDTLSKQLNTKLSQSNSAIDLNRAYENTAKKLLGSKLESFGSNSQMENAIEKLRSEISTVAGANGVVTIPEAQVIKRASGHFGAWSFGVPTPEATASQKVYNAFYNELKTQIEKESPEGVRAINQEISKLIPVMNALIRRIPVAERNSAISLKDIITLSAASLEPRALALTLMNFASKSGSVGSLLSKSPTAGKAISNFVQKLEPAARVITNQLPSSQQKQRK
jgi:hypothetical protein